MEYPLSFLLTVPYLLPMVLTMLAVAVLQVGLPRAPRYRRPGRWRAGVIMTALVLISIWLLPAGVFMFVGNTQIEGLLFILALVCGAGVLGGGLQALSKANNRSLQHHAEAATYYESQLRKAA
jgi:hypothetical protein